MDNLLTETIRWYLREGASEVNQALLDITADPMGLREMPVENLDIDFPAIDSDLLSCLLTFDGLPARVCSDGLCRILIRGDAERELLYHQYADTHAGNITEISRIFKEITRKVKEVKESHDSQSV